MRIAINCRSFLKKRYTGIGRYAHQLVQSLTEIDNKNSYWLYVPRRAFDLKRRVPRFSAPNFSVKIDPFQNGLDKILKEVGIYHSPSPDFIPETRCKVVASIHDLVYKTYPEGHTPETCETTDKQIKAIVSQADRIICSSQSTSQDLKRFFNVEDHKLKVIYPGGAKKDFHMFDEAQRQKAGSILSKKEIAQPFLLFVGTIEPRKNLKHLLRAVSILRKKKQFTGQLVVVGMKGWGTEGLEKFIKELDLTKSVVFPGYLDDVELLCLYNMAEVFVYPSFYEGFGFPLVEAFSCGTPVVTSNVSSCPEIVNDAALTIDPRSPDQMAEAISSVVNDKNLRESLKNKALERSLDFSFIKTAHQTLELYQEVYDS